MERQRENVKGPVTNNQDALEDPVDVHTEYKESISPWDWTEHNADLF